MKVFTRTDCCEEGRDAHFRTGARLFGGPFIGERLVEAGGKSALAMRSKVRVRATYNFYRSCGRSSTQHQPAACLDAFQTRGPAGVDLESWIDLDLTAN